jgi:hypothetical protein
MNQFQNVGHTMRKTANFISTKWKKSSTVTKAIIIGSATAVAATVAAPLVIIPALGGVGFTSAGVAAGSLAASMQTATTVSGGFFALCQSAAATGAVAASTSMGVGLAAGAAASGVTATVCRKKPRGPNNNRQTQTGTEEDEDAQDESDESHDLLNSDTPTSDPSAPPNNDKQTQTEIEEDEDTQDENYASHDLLNSGTPTSVPPAP